MRPSEKMESCSSAPPEKSVKSPKTVFSMLSKKFRTTAGSMPGVTMKAPTR
jgi:hypothetical protein